MRSTRFMVAFAGIAMGIASASMAVEVQLDISSGFNTDNWCGYLEYQALLTVGATDLAEAQGASPLNGQGRQAFDAFNYGLVGEIDPDTAAAMGVGSSDGSGTYWGYAIDSSWWKTRYPGDHASATGYTVPSPARPEDPTAATPLDGVITGADRVYHIASHAGNATLDGDWLEAADVSFTGSGSSVTSNMAMKHNAMTTWSPNNISGGNITSTAATLDVEQQGKYTDINFVLAGWDETNIARGMQIVAVYEDLSEDILCTFDDSGPAGPKTEDTSAPAGFNIVWTMTHGYNVSGGATGSITGHAGSLFEFETALALDDTKVLAGIRLEDSRPTTNWQARGLSIYAATATPAATLAVLLGDANNDGVVSADDFAAVQTNFGNTGAADGLLPGDANDDGVVSADDFAAIQTNFGNVLGAAADAAPVPEPATMALLGLGGLAMIRRRRA